MASSYTLLELCELADVTPRTVRYYIQQGLLRSPDPAGSLTRYDESHLWRLRLTKELQREHLPLAEIRKRLAALGDEEVRSLTARPPAGLRESAADYIQDVLGSRGMPRTTSQSVAVHEAPVGGPPASPPDAAAGPGRAAASYSATTSAPDRSQWDRVALTPDVELHIRRPLSRDHNRRVDRLIGIARNLLQEDTP